MLLVIVIILAVLQIRHALQYCPTETSIIQTDTRALHAELLLEKQPLILQDAYNSNAVRATLGMMCLMSNSEVVVPSKQLAYSAYTVVIPKYDDQLLVNIVHPRYRKTNADVSQLIGQFIEVRLAKGQALVLPFLWTYQCTDEAVVTHIWDISHSLGLAYLKVFKA